ncbi:sensor histidine kinase [Kitasatospora sp. CB02891]|uniref:sensor histidine kinase n=1 Tax=Kitasatospora sp. CB02891 TaxID=2020329 RepID=UPI000C27F0D5|nr:histidine kinase [Kitasatospora sp. CB02891]PJN25468.1 two-component sensor histidine kinase [Kitasatospora sp. CB02891]
MRGHRGDGDTGGQLRRRPDGLPWSRNDAMVAVGAGLLDLIGYLLSTAVTGGSNVPGFLLALLSGLPLLFRRTHPLPTYAAVLVLQVGVNLAGPVAIHFGAVLMVALFSLARQSRIRVTAAAVVVTSALTVVTQSHFRTPTWDAVIAAPASALLVAGAALVVARWQREVAANRRLLADRAVADERRRIARELHDIVAHHITTMQLMAGGARANLADPEVVRDALVTLESSGRLALREMRQLLDVLRAGDEPDAVPPAPQPGADDLARLVDDSRLAGLPTELAVHGAPRRLPPTLGLTVYRIVQEALTNARKYAGPAARATVRLTYRPDAVLVSVRDDGAGGGTGGGSAGESGGHGLIGMRERVSLHGGALNCGPHPDGGFAVLAELPLTADETAEAELQHGEVSA